MRHPYNLRSSEHHTRSGKSRTEILPLLPGWPSCSWPSCWGGRSGLWSAEGSSDLLLVVGVHPSDASPVSWNSSGFLQLVLFHCQGLLPILWPGVKTKHFIWVSMYLAPSTNWGHYVNAFSWRRDSPPVTCSSEQREGLAVRRAKTVTSLSSYFKTLRSGPALGLNPRPSSRVPKFSLNPVISVVILGILQSRISPRFGFKISNPGLEIGRIPHPELQKREIPHPEKGIGDRLPLCSQAKRSADWASAPAASGWNPRPTSPQSSVPLTELVLPTRGQMLKLSLHTWLCIAILRDWIIQISFSCIQSIQIPAFLHSFFISLDGGLLSQT